MAQHITQAPEPPSLHNDQVVPDLEGVVMKLLAKRPDDRYQSAAELIETLDKLA